QHSQAGGVAGVVADVGVALDGTGGSVVDQVAANIAAEGDVGKGGRSADGAPVIEAVAEAEVIQGGTAGKALYAVGTGVGVVRDAGAGHEVVREARTGRGDRAVEVEERAAIAAATVAAVEAGAAGGVVGGESGVQQRD